MLNHDGKHVAPEHLKGGKYRGRSDPQYIAAREALIRKAEKVADRAVEDKKPHSDFKTRADHEEWLAERSACWNRFFHTEMTRLAQQAGYTHTNVVDVLRTQIHQKIDLANKPSVGNIVNQGDAQIPLSGPSLSDIPSLFTHHNPYHLVPDKLIQVYETYQRNIAHYFPGDHLKDWADMKNLKTHAILNNPVYENNPHYQPLLNYIHMLKDNTGLKPKGWSIFHGAESSESYIVRALQKLLK